MHTSMATARQILLADDDPRDVELTLSALKDTPLANEVFVVHDGEQLLDYLLKRNQFADREGGNPAVILLDLKMPKLDGIDVLREMGKHVELRTVPVVVLTSSREERDLDECYRLNCNAFVVKPVNYREFVDAVKQVGVFWAAVNEPPP